VEGDHGHSPHGPGKHRSRSSSLLVARCLVCSYKSGVYSERRGVGVAAVRTNLGLATIAVRRLPKLQAPIAGQHGRAPSALNWRTV